MFIPTEDCCQLINRAVYPNYVVSLVFSYLVVHLLQHLNNVSCQISLMNVLVFFLDGCGREESCLVPKQCFLPDLRCSLGMFRGEGTFCDNFRAALQVSSLNIMYIAHNMYP